mmetsp:Transcript_4544/g.13885  ORF Transcript_4544/g.13885 Transcript_4544/m.13885 type:complete len:292 (-) Transcript_4544:7-882(-)|eukprot:CAMPEP_0177650978 /NCGR_PEP_ID=MMETSP0447-20121125/12261_1 /TAXON_ID=0 /ORGANISM="Stygamoeba regulata, Strain BSH-02190019" /LENGTH=291 /DNA_ID=CAMNT_0019153945 /DNA_START=28 /DNA_END=903 /DNA_ORIENTATION=-
METEKKEEKSSITYKCLFSQSTTALKYGQAPSEDRKSCFFTTTWGKDISVKTAVAQNIICKRFRQALEKDCAQEVAWAPDEWIYFCPSILLEIIIHEFCPFCGATLNENNVTLDRIDDGQHHHAHNVHLVCIGCKSARLGYYSAEEFKKICLFLLDARKLPVRPELPERAFMPLTSYFDNKKWRDVQERCRNEVVAKVQRRVLPGHVISKINRRLKKHHLTPAEECRVNDLLLTTDHVHVWVRDFVYKYIEIVPFCTYKSIYVQEFYQALLDTCVSHVITNLEEDIPELYD